MGEQSVTICANCKHHLNKRDGPRTDIWYNWYCTHPNYESQLIVDVVTGKKVYGKINDLGRPYTTDKKHPYCREINSGYCEDYEEKSSLFRLISKK